MGHKVETGPECVCRHIRGPNPNKMITDQIRSTLHLIDPVATVKAGRRPPARASALTAARTCHHHESGARAPRNDLQPAAKNVTMSRDTC